MASKLYIGGLAYSTTSDGLREFFSQCGNVLSATVITDRFSGQSRGFGFVEMATAEEAQNAISQLNGREFDGRKITVELSNPQGQRSGGPRPGGNRPGGGGRGPEGVGGPQGAPRPEARRGGDGGPAVRAESVILVVRAGGGRGAAVRAAAVGEASL